MACIVRRRAVSLRLRASLTLLCCSGLVVIVRLAAICNPAFHAVLWIIHRNHGLTNHLGKGFIQHARIKANAEPNIMGAEQLLSAAADSVSSQPLCSCLEVFAGPLANSGNIADGNGKSTRHLTMLLAASFERVKTCSKLKIQKKFQRFTCCQI